MWAGPCTAVQGTCNADADFPRCRLRPQTFVADLRLFAEEHFRYDACRKDSGRTAPRACRFGQGIFWRRAQERKPESRLDDSTTFAGHVRIRHPRYVLPSRTLCHFSRKAATGRSHELAHGAVQHAYRTRKDPERPEKRSVAHYGFQHLRPLRIEHPQALVGMA